MLNSDINLSRARNFRFRVAQKNDRNAVWEIVAPEITDLGEAVKLAQSLEAYEVAVFVLNSNSEVIYWSSRSPNGFNSAVLM